MGNFVTWSSKYAVGIASIDAQHKKLVDLTNQLFEACIKEKNDITDSYQRVAKELVEYVKVHFKDEEDMQNEVKYPNMTAHKKEHEQFIIHLIASIKDFESGKPFAPNQFARYLADWLLSHIAMKDTEFARYYLSVKGAS